MRPLSKIGTVLLKGAFEAFSNGNRLSVVVEFNAVSHLNLPIWPYSKSWGSSLLLFLPLVSPQRSAQAVNLVDIISWQHLRSISEFVFRLLETCRIKNRRLIHALQKFPNYWSVFLAIIFRLKLIFLKLSSAINNHPIFTICIFHFLYTILI